MAADDAKDTTAIAPDANVVRKIIAVLLCDEDVFPPQSKGTRPPLRQKRNGRIRCMTEQCSEKYRAAFYREFMPRTVGTLIVLGAYCVGVTSRSSAHSCPLWVNS